MAENATSSAPQSTTGETTSQRCLGAAPEAETAAPATAAVSDKAVKETTVNAVADTKGTFRYQSSLPKLEVPLLDETLAKYLDAVAPLLSPEAFSRTKAVVEEVGESLAHLCIEQALYLVRGSGVWVIANRRG